VLVVAPAPLAAAPPDPVAAVELFSMVLPTPPSFIPLHAEAPTRVSDVAPINPAAIQMFRPNAAMPYGTPALARCQHNL
jgi:hypothetical protein